MNQMENCRMMTAAVAAMATGDNGVTCAQRRPHLDKMSKQSNVYRNALLCE